MALRYSFGLLPIVVLVACSGSSTSHGPGGGSGASSAQGGTGATGGATGGSGGSTTGSGGRGGTGAGGGVGGSGAVGGAAGTGGVYIAGGRETCGPGGCIPDDPGEPIDPPGPVYCGGVECPAENACCTTTGECFDPQRNPEVCPEPAPDDDLWGRKPCTSNSHCTARQFCQMDTPTCLGTGHCNPRTNCGGCGGDCAICGCDGNTYPDQQTACLAGANVLGRGACGVPTETGGGGSGGSGPDGGAPVRVRIPCAHSEQCPEDQVCCPRYGECVLGDAPYLCSEAPPGTRKPCTVDEQCEPHEYCLGEGCSGPGGCVNVGSQGDCGVRLEPVCGCNGVSYTSAACASTEAVRIASEGQCPAAG